jgi:prepilin-type processing-associated H-X9-DG protein
MTRIATCLCPSDTPSTTSVNNSYINVAPGWAFPLYNYACNWGNTDYLQGPINGIPFLGAPFGDLYPQTDNNTTFGPTGTFGFRSITDGTSNTMMVSEVVQGQTSSTSTASGDIRGLTVWSVGATYEAMIPPNSGLPGDVLYQAGLCQYPYQNNPPCTFPSTANLQILFGARSRHPGGVNVGFIDGSVRFIKNTINLATWSAISTTQGNEVVSADQY